MTSSNNQTDLCYASATALAADIRRGERSPVAVVDAFLDRIERVNPEINAYVTVCSESAREAAREAERAPNAVTTSARFTVSRLRSGSKPRRWRADHVRIPGLR